MVTGVVADGGNNDGPETPEPLAAEATTTTNASAESTPEDAETTTTTTVFQTSNAPQPETYSEYSGAIRDFAVGSPVSPALKAGEPTRYSDTSMDR